MNTDISGSNCRRPPISSIIAVPRNSGTTQAAAAAPNIRLAMRRNSKAEPNVASSVGNRIAGSHQPVAHPHKPESQYTSGGLSG